MTTNYDRLIEVQAARAGVSVDTGFYGHTLGRLDPQRSKGELLRREPSPGSPSKVRLKSWPHIRLSKPHGSLGWFRHRDELLRSDLPMPGLDQIIAPGGSKYRLGYESPI